MAGPAHVLIVTHLSERDPAKRDRGLPGRGSSGTLVAHHGPDPSREAPPVRLGRPARRARRHQPAGALRDRGRPAPRPLLPLRGAGRLGRHRPLHDRRDLRATDLPGALRLGARVLRRHAVPGLLPAALLSRGRGADPPRRALRGRLPRHPDAGVGRGAGAGLCRRAAPDRRPGGGLGGRGARHRLPRRRPSDLELRHHPARHLRHRPLDPAPGLRLRARVLRLPARRRPPAAGRRARRPLPGGSRSHQRPRGVGRGVPVRRSDGRPHDRRTHGPQAPARPRAPRRGRRDGGRPVDGLGAPHARPARVRADHGARAAAGRPRGAGVLQARRLPGALGPGRLGRPQRRGPGSRRQHGSASRREPGAAGRRARRLGTPARALHDRLPVPHRVPGGVPRLVGAAGDLLALGPPRSGARRRGPLLRPRRSGRGPDRQRQRRAGGRLPARAHAARRPDRRPGARRDGERRPLRHLRPPGARRSGRRAVAHHGVPGVGGERALRRAAAQQPLDAPGDVRHRQQGASRRRARGPARGAAPGAPRALRRPRLRAQEPGGPLPARSLAGGPAAHRAGPPLGRVRARGAARAGARRLRGRTRVPAGAHLRRLERQAPARVRLRLRAPGRGDVRRRPARGAARAIANRRHRRGGGLGPLPGGAGDRVPLSRPRASGAGARDVRPRAGPRAPRERRPALRAPGRARRGSCRACASSGACRRRSARPSANERP